MALGMPDVGRIPSPVPYLHADGHSEEQWRELLSAGPNRLKVGLAWVGSSVHVDDRMRSVSLETLAPLARADVQFYSLQLGRGSEQAANPPAEMELIDLTNRIVDFADTAGLVSQLDLVICVDTSVAHLAGALGKPVWVMLPYRPDYRWLLDREDTPWYPTMRLFRQQTPEDWDEVVGRIAKALDLAVQSPVEPQKN
jgi:hypothetical protein